MSAVAPSMRSSAVPAFWETKLNSSRSASSRESFGGLVVSWIVWWRISAPEATIVKRFRKWVTAFNVPSDRMTCSRASPASSVTSTSLVKAAPEASTMTSFTRLVSSTTGSGAVSAAFGGGVGS